MSGAEMYNPIGNAWTPVAPMYRARAGHTATPLLDGRVLIAGGNDGSLSLDSLEIYDPYAAVFTLVTARLSAPRTGHGADLLYSGRVAIVGGSDGARALKSIDIFDPRSESIAAGPSLATPRAGQSVTRLLDGKVLVAGGASNASELSSVEIYDPRSNTIAPAGGSVATPRQRHQALLLPHNNAVAIVGRISGDKAE